MLAGRFGLRRQAQAAGHAKMQHDVTVVKLNKDVLGSTSNGANDAAGNKTIERSWNRPSQPGIANGDRGYLASDQIGSYSAYSGFYFRQFRH